MNIHNTTSSFFLGFDVKIALPRIVKTSGTNPDDLKRFKAVQNPGDLNVWFVFYLPPFRKKRRGKSAEARPIYPLHVSRKIMDRETCFKILAEFFTGYPNRRPGKRLIPREMSALSS